MYGDIIKVNPFQQKMDSHISCVAPDRIAMDVASTVPRPSHLNFQADPSLPIDFRQQFPLDGFNLSHLTSRQDRAWNLGLMACWCLETRLGS